MPKILNDELTVRFQFLEEAEPYFSAVESVLLGLAGLGVEPQKMDGALRAAHSLKGGAGMMGLGALSATAHRLEDTLKVLKARRPVVDASLEDLLLQGVDCLRQIARMNRQGQEAEPLWIERYAEPIFAALDSRLGALRPEDEANLLSEESGLDVRKLLFETEVEASLERLEAVLDTPGQPNLEAELSILAQELEGLGQMLQMDNFSSLCRSVAEAIAAFPGQLETVARLAAQEWRRARAMVLVDQLDAIPTAISLSATTASEAGPQAPALVEQSTDFLSWLFTEASTPVPQPLRSELTALPLPVLPSQPARTELLSAVPATELSEANAIRVPVKRLDQLNDLCGELTIGRNGLELHLSRLRNLVTTLSRRVRELEQSNLLVRTAYDRSQVASGMAAREQLLRDGFDSLEMDRYGERHLLWQEVMETVAWIQEVTGDVDLTLQDAEQVSSQFKRSVKQLQTTVMQARMRPLSDLTERFPRAIRDLSVQFAKPVTLAVKGGSTLVDRAILDALGDPLMHLLRNAFDHGIERPELRARRAKPAQGHIDIQAYHRGNRTIIRVSDDGGGIDCEKVRVRAGSLGIPAAQLEKATDKDLIELIFEPGFSTASAVTSLSGRGVGMDVVRTHLERLRGTVEVETQPGQGTTFTLSVPLMLSALRVLLVEAGGMLIAFPSDTVEQMAILTPEQLANRESETFDWEGYPVENVAVGDWLRFRGTTRTAETEDAAVLSVPAALIVSEGEAVACLQVERCWGEREVAVRQVEGLLPMPAGFWGCTILGNGQVVPIADVPGLFNWMAERRKTGDQARLISVPAPAERAPSQTVLIVDDSINVRQLLALHLEKAGYAVEQAKDGEDALTRLFSGLEVQAVICDIEMPRLDGYGFLSRLRGKEAFKALPVAMLTSRSGDKHRKLAMALGATAYFTKPYREKEMLTALAQMIVAVTPS